jgi:alkylation response protein AidB-like acyl-CoA dehydrogenase
MAIVEAARRLADETLFPASLTTDASDTLPVELLDALADAGLYGLTGPASAGGLDADFKTVCDVVEALASGCLTTTFVWTQHLGAVMAAASSDNEAMRDWVEPLCQGSRRAGLALGGARAGTPSLHAREADGGRVVRGTSPFVSGWRRVDVIHTAARTEDDRLVWALVDARESETLAVERVDLVALNATATVSVEFRDHPVPATRVTSAAPFEPGATPPHTLRVHASFGLGVAARCCALLGPTPLDDELNELRAELDRLDPSSIERARAAAGELALRAAAALAVRTGSGSLLMRDHAQRLVREAMFCLVYALRPGSRDAALALLTAARGAPGPSG